MIAVIGCGNPNRTDDGVGLEVIRLLRCMPELQARPEVKLLDAGTDGMAVMFAARGCTCLIVVDCCKTQTKPGVIFEVPGDELASPHQPSLNLHDFRWDHAIYTGRQIYRDAFPADVTAYLIEGENFAFGCGLTPVVQEAAMKAGARIAARIRSIPHQPSSNGAEP